MGLRDQLAEARSICGQAPGAALPRHRPRCGPGLTTGYSLAAMAKAAAGGDRPAPAAPERAEPMGLSEPQNSDKPCRRYGLKGMSRCGFRSVRAGLAWLEEQRRQLAFWTITLDDETQALIAADDRWDVFQNAIRHRLTRELKAQGLEPLVIGVAEVHPQRSERMGRPCCHLHVVFVGRKTRWHRWAIDRWRLDSFIAAAARAATGRRMATRAAGNVQPVRRSVAAYMAKYLSKGHGQGLVCVATGIGLPRQWWFQSRPMLDRVREATAALPLAFVGWVHRNRWGLAGLGRLAFGDIGGGDDRPPDGHWVAWSSAGALVGTLRDWQRLEAEVTLRCSQSPGLSDDRHCSQPDSVRNQHL